MKRTVFLFCLSLLIGLGLVYLRTQHMHSVYRMTQLIRQEQDLRHNIWQQQLQLSGALDSPQRIKEQVQKLQLSIHAPEEDGTDSKGKNP